MADPSDIDVVRRQTGELENVDPFTDAYLAGLIDANGVTGATVIVYEQLAAKFARLVDTTEAGASHKFSDLFKNANAQAAYYRGILLVEVGEAPERTKVKKVVRT